MTNPVQSLKDKIAAKMAEKVVIEENIRVHIPKDGVWKVEIFIPFEEMSQERMTNILRGAKSKISTRDKIPIGLLSYEDLVEKEVRENGYQVTAKIVQTEAEIGNPELKLMKASSPEGVEYEDMLVLVSVFPKKEGGDEVKLKDVTEIIRNAKLGNINIDYKLLDEALIKVRKDMVAVKNLMLYQGRFPDPSEDAYINYNVKFRELSEGTLLGAEVVKLDQSIIKKSSARAGEKDGYNVKGVLLKPRIPRDIEIIAGENCRITADNTEAFALKPGIPKIRELPTDVNSPLMRLSISVETVEVIDGSQKIDISSGNHLEIKGGLKSGSRVIARGEVFVHGDVEEGTSVSASGNISVTGEIKGGSLVSEKDIDSNGNVTGSQLMAHGKLTIKGIAKNSLLRGLEVNSAQVVGCEIIVGSKSVIDMVSPDEKGFTAKITAGMSGHLREKINENQKFIDYASKNLKRFEEIVGQDIVQEATPANVSRMTIAYCRNTKEKGIKTIPKNKIDIVKTLIIAIGPIRDTMNEKSKAIKMFLKQIEQDEESNPEVRINKLMESAEVEINGVKGEVQTSEEPVVIRQNGGVFTVETVKANTQEE